MTRIVFTSALIAAILSGCAQGFLSPDQGPKPMFRACSGSTANTVDCEINVNVTPSSDPAKVCDIAVAAGLDVVRFKIAPGDKKKIQWKLNSSDFVFRQHSGIEFKDPKAPFTPGSNNPQSSVYTVTNNGQNKPGGPDEDYYYGIHLERKDNGMLCGFDPVIRNQR